MTTTLLPDVDVARADCATLLSVQAPGDHGEEAGHDGMKNDMCVLDRANADGHAGWRLHPGLCVVGEAVHGGGEMVRGKKLETGWYLLKRKALDKVRYCIAGRLWAHAGGHRLETCP